MKTKLWLVAALMLGACGDDGGGGSALKFEDYDAATVDALCQQFVRCGLAADQAACVATFQQTQTSATLVADVASGKVTFDGAAARECFDAIANASCEVTSVSYRTRPLACFTMFQGQVAEGDACTINEQCVSQHCGVPSCGMACCPGTCVGDTAPVLAKLGESCELSPCDETSYCDQVDRTCVALRGANGSCQSGEACADGLYCLQSGVCGSLPGDGQTCGVDGCQLADERCDATTHVCTKPGSDGAACATNDDCVGIYSCDAATKKCTIGLPENAACRRVDRCAGSLRCDIAEGEDSGFCHPRHPAGGACQADADCVYRCNLDSGTCYADQACS